jgi:hypothetical protein
MEKLKRVFSRKMAITIIATGLYRVHTSFKTDTYFHSYIAYGCRGSPCGNLKTSPVFVGQYHLWGPSCLILSFLLHLFSVLGYSCFSAPVRTDPGAHPASYNVYRVFPRG